MPDHNSIISVAVPVPLRQTFDFTLPPNLRAGASQSLIGMRVRVPFGNRRLIGFITELKSHTAFEKTKLKAVIDIVDEAPVFTEDLWATLKWMSSYYLAPIGEVLAAATPVKLRQGDEQTPQASKQWSLSEKGRSNAIDELSRAPLQLAIIKRFMSERRLRPSDFKDESKGWRQAINALVEKGWVRENTDLPKLTTTKPRLEREFEHADQLILNVEQLEASQSMYKRIEDEEFSCTLLHGVTGSGKTEVYFETMQKTLDAGKQVLLLVPEIGLTPQLIERIEARFSVPLVTMHSGLNDTERHLAWWFARQGEASIVLGTRSAVFTSFSNLGLIVVDEEHDASFKQQDKVRYQARDVAIYRAKQANIPVLLGSATPSLESYVNAKSGRYYLSRLTNRATEAALPSVELFDMNVLPSKDGLSPAMVEAIKATLDSSKQVILYLNRRGFAPVMYCTECSATTDCHRCDSHLTFHQRINRLRCHHCGYEGRASLDCSSCGAKESLIGVGEGTQRIEGALRQLFPEANILRIDRDSTRRKGELAELLKQAQNEEADIILGTQLLTKGHDFPGVSMVGILGADHGLYSTDFRATEFLFQQLLQVAGRAGRRNTIGKVFIQTAFPDHPFFERIKNHEFEIFADELLDERKRAAYPPYSNFALIRAESTHQSKALQFLRSVKTELEQQADSSEILVMDAVPAAMEHRAGKYRAQLLVSAAQRSPLNRCFSNWLSSSSQPGAFNKLGSSIRWSIDIDPIDLY